MLKMEVLQQILDDPPADVLELYSRLCAAHAYTFGDATVVGKLYAHTMATPPKDSVFIDAVKGEVGYNIIATCFVGTTVDGVTTYAPRLGIFIRGYTSTQTINTLTTEILGKKLATHIAEAMGYDDYIIVRPYSTSYYRPGDDNPVGSGWVMPLVIPPGVTFETSDPGRYVNANDASNTSIFAALVAANPAAYLSEPITVGGLSVKPPVWFTISQNYGDVTIPLATYLADDQCWATVNDKVDVLQQQRIDKCSDDIAELDNARETLDDATDDLRDGYTSLVELVGALSVFGNTVKDVTTRYNDVSQYIPRP